MDIEEAKRVMRRRFGPRVKLEAKAREIIGDKSFHFGEDEAVTQLIGAATVVLDHAESSGLSRAFDDDAAAGSPETKDDAAAGSPETKDDAAAGSPETKDDEEVPLKAKKLWNWYRSVDMQTVSHIGDETTKAFWKEMKRRKISLAKLEADQDLRDKVFAMMTQYSEGFTGRAVRDRKRPRPHTDTAQ